MDSDRMKNTDSQFISFQDFVPMHNSGPANQAQINIGASTHPHFNNLSNDTTGIGILEDLQGMPGKTDDSTTPRSFWTIEYYQKYFNVNTNDVVERIKRSMNPQSADNYLVTHIRPNPDLYGPFWICATLVFSIAISGNLASYIEYAHADNYHWRYNFHVVSHAATCIFLYAYLLPFVLWCAIKWSTTQGEQEELIEPSAVPGLLEVICLYGYSLAIYIPVAFLWTIQITLLQWALVIVATCLSGGVLLKSLVPVIVSGKHKLIYTAIILGMHLLLGAGFMLYFFHIPSKNPVALHPVNMMTVSPPVVSPSINASAKILDAQ